MAQRITLFFGAISMVLVPVITEAAPLNHYSDYGVTEQSASIQNTTVSINNDPFGYSDAYTDNENGLQYMQVRYYDPVMMRFTQMDTYPLLNRYAYADENPIMKDDPSGHIAIGVSNLNNKGISNKSVPGIVGMSAITVLGIIISLSTDNPATATETVVAEIENIDSEKLTKMGFSSLERTAKRGGGSIGDIFFNGEKSQVLKIIKYPEASEGDNKKMLLNAVQEWNAFFKSQEGLENLANAKAITVEHPDLGKSYAMLTPYIEHSPIEVNAYTEIPNNIKNYLKREGKLFLDFYTNGNIAMHNQTPVIMDFDYIISATTSENETPWSIQVRSTFSDRTYKAYLAAGGPRPQS